MSEALPARRAVALGLVQGPAELLPVSSSAHLVLGPWLVGWDWEQIDPELRKSFEVALHAGAAAALLIGQRRVIGEELRQFEHRRAIVLALSFVPAAFVGYAFERPIIVGASALKGARLARRGTTPEVRRSLAIGVGASFASTLASQRLIGLVERDRALWPYAAYRAGLAAVVLFRLRR